MMEFKEPPPSGTGGPGKWVEEAAVLRERPGEWVLLGRLPDYTASNITGGRLKAFESGKYEAVQRETRDGLADIYVRYIGE